MKLQQFQWDGKKKWCWVSSPASVSFSVFSVLAILETLIACSLTLYIGIHFSCWIYLAGWIALTPFLLLRNDAATRLAVKKLKAKYPLDKYNYNEITNSHLVGFFIVLKAFLIIIFIRISTILQTVILYKFKVLSNIPSNWAIYSLQMDLFHPLEIIPGFEQLKIKDPDDNFLNRASIYSLYSRLKRKNFGISNYKKFIRYSIYSIVFFLAYLPSFMYRWSLKSTALVYMSFIYLSKDISFSNDTLNERSIRINSNKFSLFYAVVIVIIIYTIMPVIIATFTNFLVDCSKDSIFAYHLVNYFTIKPCIERWNIARLICAFITVIMFLLASISIKLISMNIDVENMFLGKLIDFSLRTINIFRSIGALYVIFCGIILFWSNMGSLEWLLSIKWIFPEIGNSWFPQIDNP
jgi:hypothetical protein